MLQRSARSIGRWVRHSRYRGQRLFSTKPNPDRVDLVLYHQNCMDGFGAAYAAWRRFGDTIKYQAASFSSNRSVPDVTDLHVVVCDFSFSTRTTKVMLEKCASLVILDHHISNKQVVDKLPQENYVFDITKSGAMLAWEYFHNAAPPPDFLKYIEDRDLWTFKLPFSREFSTAFMLVPFKFRMYHEFAVHSCKIKMTIDSGAHMLGYQEWIVDKAVRSAVRRTFRGHKAAVTSSSVLRSEVGHALCERLKVDLAMVVHFSVRDNRVVVSLRGNGDSTIDCASLAEKFGGGGHRLAAAFRLRSLADLDTIFDENSPESDSSSKTISSQTASEVTCQYCSKTMLAQSFKKHLRTYSGRENHPV